MLILTFKSLFEYDRFEAGVLGTFRTSQNVKDLGNSFETFLNDQGWVDCYGHHPCTDLTGMTVIT